MTRHRRGSPRLEKALLLAMGMVAIYLPLVPYSLAAGDAGSPDLLSCLVIAWIVRRPDTAPLVLVVILGLLADVLTSRPLGLGALGLVICAELFRAQRGLLVGLPFVLEWLVVTVATMAVALCSFLLLKLTFMDGPSVRQLASHALVTSISYPVVVGVLYWMMGVRAPDARPQPGRLDPLT
jgi:rod shape-determining protein MreD